MHETSSYMEHAGVTSPKFNSPDADIIVRSSDDVLFHLHKRNLEFATGGFPSATTPTNGETVSLSETAETLEVLFQFVYPQRYLQLERMPFKQVLALAEAAEKYEVYAAMSVCLSRMKDFIRSEHAKEILIFTAKHNYFFFAEQLAPILVAIPLTEIATILPSYIYTPWSIYREQRLLAVYGASMNAIAEFDHECTTWQAIRKRVAAHLNGNHMSKEQISSLFEGLRKENPYGLRSLSNCVLCVRQAFQWEKKIVEATDAVPPFTLPKDK